MEGNSGVGDAEDNCIEGGVGGNSGVGDAGENCVEGGAGGNSGVCSVGGNSGVGDVGQNCVTGGMGRNSIEGGAGKNCVEGGVGEKAGSDCPLGNNKRGQPHTDRAPLSPPQKRVKSASADEKSYPLFCCCRDIEHGKMVCCDNENCVFLWFRFRCVGLTRTPKGRWYCPECKCLPQFKSMKTLPKKTM